MESILFDLNPSMKQFTDNALRMNNMLHKAQHHESKAKTSKASKTAGSNIGTDTAFSGDDMMGGMDLGDYRGGGSSSFESFRQSEDDSDSPDRKPPNLSAMLSCMNNNSTSELPSNIYQDQKVNNQVLPVSENSYRQNDSENNLSVTAPENNNVGVLSGNEYNNSSESQYSQETSIDKPPAQTEILNEHNFSVDVEPKKETTDSVSTVSEKIENNKKYKSSKSQEQVVISKEPEKKKEEKVDQKVEVKKESAWNSLLSFDEGFLIATDEKFLQLGAVDEVNPDEPEAVSFEKVSVPVVDTSVSEVEILKSIIPVNAFSDYEYSMLVYYLSFYGKKVLKLCADFGVKILPNALNGSLGIYSKNEKTCFILPSSLNSNELFIAPRLYMAVAFDHALGGEDFSSEKSPAVLSSWQMCRDRINGHLFQDIFSSSTPSRYFAQSVESFLRQRDECPNSYFFNHDQLYDYDRSMFSYVEYLFNQMKG